MHRIFATWIGLVFAFSVHGALAADAKPKKSFSEKQLAQQQRMIDCSAEAKQNHLKGDQRLAFMQTCLSGGQVTVEVGDVSASMPDDAPAEGR